MNNQQGKRAEAIFGMRITQERIFRARDLGEKWPVADYYVEVDNDDEPLFFIVQVKSSRRGYDRRGNLRIGVSREKLNQLAPYHAPTFIAGVDVEREIVYLSPLYRERARGVSKISTIFVLNVTDAQTSVTNLKKLKHEISRFWNGANTRTIKSNFKSQL